MWDIGTRNFPHPQLSPRSKDLRDNAIGPKIPVIVGRENAVGGRKTFYVYKSLLIAHSQFFEIATSERWQKGPSEVILNDEEPKIFEMFLQWMCTGNFNYITDSFWDNETFDELAKKEEAKENSGRRVDVTSIHLPRLSWAFYCIKRKDNLTISRYDMENRRFIEGIKGNPEYEGGLLRNREWEVERAVERFLDPENPCSSIIEEPMGQLAEQNPFSDLGDPYDTFREPWALSYKEKQYIQSDFGAKIETIWTSLVDPKQALETLIRLYVFADKFSVDELKDRAIDAMRGQSIDLLDFIDLDHIDMIYANTMAGADLRELAVRHVVVGEQMNRFEKPQFMNTRLGEFFFDLSKFQFDLSSYYYDEDVDEYMASTKVNECHYHCHSKKPEGGFCPYFWRSPWLGRLKD